MTIGFHHVTPAPLAGVIDSETAIWQTTCVFKPGGRYQIVAHSGKGKSTFIHYIYGLRNDYTGDVMLDQQEAKAITADQWAALRRQHLSIVFQDLRLFLHLTALENIEVKAALYENGSEEKITRMAEALHVAHVLTKKCSTLSYGERQRIAIIRALLQPFDWILLDEPFSHLDAENTRNAAALIEEEVSQRKAGILLTSLGQDRHLRCDHELKL